ncbi:V-type ATPase subunit [Clostridium rectalis]|uniref:V-type ATPase subunit n=1 Tax=Clostridium rectalis TaxID=2040295 RepID=UPI000F63994F|nr:V-type ATPase subunit [Clostridium rectalis]
MGSIAKYAAVNTKVKTLEGKLLTEEQYSKLMESKSYTDALRYLKENTDYKDALKGYNVETVHRGQLEYILKKHYIEDFYKLSHYFSGDYKRLFKILFMRFEIEDLKVILRGKYADKEKEYIESIMTYESPLNYINYDDLIKAKDIYSAVQVLKNTQYYKHIHPLLDSVKEEGLFRIEMTLDFIYFSSLRKFSKKLNKEDEEIIKKLIGIYSDLLNIQWIFRGKKYYKINAEELLNYTIYDGYKLKSDTLKKLCYSKDTEEMFSIISTTPYKNVFGDGEKEEYLIEKDILTYMKRVYLKYKKTHGNNISVVMSYLELALLEIRDVVSIIESKRYSIDNEEAFRYVTITV